MNQGYSLHDYESYYLNQTGYGSIPVYHGVSVQRGYGLGNILASAFRSVMPLFKRGATYLGKKILNTGAKVASDVASGVSIKQALKSHAKTAGRETLHSAADVVKSMTGSGVKRTRRKRKPVISRRTKKRRTSLGSYSDIFS